MKHNNLRRPYAAPSAELICLAPNAPIATTPSWKWSGGSKNNSGDWLTKNHWGATFDAVSVTGLMDWVDEYDTNKNPVNKELD